MSGLPDGWAETTLSMVASITTGNTPSTKNPELYGGSVPFAKPGDLDTRVPITSTEQCLSEEGASQARVLRPGAVLVSCIGNLGKVGIAGASLATNQQINSAEFYPFVVDDRYGYFVCKTLKPWMEREASATTIAILNKGRFSEAPFPLAPLPEQKRIADKLDSVLARVDACRDRLDRLPALLKRFRQSILSAATSGRLTEDWRNLHTPNLNKADWLQTTLSELCETGRVITYGVIKLGDETPDGVPCLRTSNVRWLDIELNGIKRIASSLSNEYRRTILQGTEVLVNVRGTLGGVVAATPSMKGWNVSREVAVVPVAPESAFAKFIELWIASDCSQRWLSKVEKGVAYVGINIEDLKNLPVAQPPIDEQTEIVRRVELLFAFADRLEARLATARRQVGQLTPALLAKAFRGELVPQDPADEPAAELLKRLAAQREAAPKARRGRASKA